MLLTNVTKWAVFCYALLLIPLGFLGFYFGGSMASLVCGGSFGVILLLSAFAMFKKKKMGAYVAFVIAFFLTGFFSYRYSITHSLIPALLAVLSASLLIILLTQLSKKTH